jgi:hypothetical protein
MVEVFKTNVQNKFQAKKLISILSGFFTEYKINFDLDDCDNILRVEANLISVNEIIVIIRNEGFACALLE